MNQTIGERIGLIIEAKKLKKVQFAAKLHIDQSYVTQLINGRSNPSKRLMIDICEKYAIRPEWLEHGTGEMDLQITREEQVGEFLTGAWKGNDPFKQKIIAGLAALDENDWKNLKAIIEKMTKNMAGEE